MTTDEDPPEAPPAYRVLPSPQSLLPPKTKYRRSLGDLFGDDATVYPTALYAFVCLTPVFCVIGFLLGDRILNLGGWTVPFALASGVGGGLAVAYGAIRFARTAGRTVVSFTAPSGSSTPYQRGFSAHEALAAAGRVDEALAGYESEVQRVPADVEALVRTADLYIEHRRSPERAAELLRMVRRVPGVRPERIMYASHRLVDLYLGPLNDRGRAIVELRVIIDTFPGSQAATFAREGLAKLKREHHEGADP